MAKFVVLTFVLLAMGSVGVAPLLAQAAGDMRGASTPPA